MRTDDLVVFVPDRHGQKRADAGVRDAVVALVLVDVENFSGAGHPLGQALQVSRHVFAFDLLPGTVRNRNTRADAIRETESKNNYTILRDREGERERERQRQK